jgi:hypothetical protein
MVVPPKVNDAEEVVGREEMDQYAVPNIFSQGTGGISVFPIPTNADCQALR